MKMYLFCADYYLLSIPCLLGSLCAPGGQTLWTTMALLAPASGWAQPMGDENARGERYQSIYSWSLSHNSSALSLLQHDCFSDFIPPQLQLLSHRFPQGQLPVFIRKPVPDILSSFFSCLNHSQTSVNGAFIKFSSVKLFLFWGG